MEGYEGGAVEAGGGGEEESVIGIFEREAWEAEKEGGGIGGGEKFERERLGGERED